VAAALHFKALAQGKRSIYTCPIKGAGPTKSGWRYAASSGRTT